MPNQNHINLPMIYTSGCNQRAKSRNLIQSFEKQNVIILQLFILGTGIMGFGVCFYFGSAITWLTSNTPDLKSRPMSFIFMGSNIASFVAPPIASKMFDISPIYVFYLCMICVILTVLCFLSMIFIARGMNLGDKKMKNCQNAS